jgi:hypothetical protein
MRDPSLAGYERFNPDVCLLHLPAYDHTNKLEVFDVGRCKLLRSWMGVNHFLSFPSLSCIIYIAKTDHITDSTSSAEAKSAQCTISVAILSLTVSSHGAAIAAL